VKTKTVIAACALSVVGAGALAQISFTSTDTVTFTQTFNPDGGIFASGAFTSGNTGFFTAGSDSGFSLTYLGQESTYDNGVRIAGDGQSLIESHPVGTMISGATMAGQPLDFTFFSSGGDDLANGEVIAGHSSFALLGRDLKTSLGTFAYVVGFNDSYRHDDWDDFVIGINPTPAIPEPSIYAMLIAGVGAVVFAARRRLRR
jgi:hypothetical protein